MRTKKKGYGIDWKVLYVRVAPDEHAAVMKRLAKERLKSVNDLGRNLLLAWAEGKVATP